jgi:hypothetical protein
VLKKPALRLDEPDILEASPDFLIERFGLQPGPPGADPPLALVSKNFRQNVQRLLVLVPSAGAPFGTWDADLPEGRGASAPILQWAEANDYGIAFFSAAALEADPVKAWDRVLSGSPARHVVVLPAARGALDLVHAGLKPVHELLYARIHLIFMPWEGCLPASASPSLASTLPSQPKELRAYLRDVQSHWPAEWVELDSRLLRQRIFERLKDKEDDWSAQEASKYMGLRNLKENDIPGLRRLGVDQRVARLSRDRDTDELSRLIKTNAKDRSAAIRGADFVDEDEEEEPGVD